MKVAVKRFPHSTRSGRSRNRTAMTPRCRLQIMNELMIEDREDLQRFRVWLGQHPVPRLVDWLVEAGFARRPLLIALNAERWRV